eukprot:549922-Hanusia_phi.AAC.1
MAMAVEGDEEGGSDDGHDGDNGHDGHECDDGDLYDVRGSVRFCISSLNLHGSRHLSKLSEADLNSRE